MVKFHPKLLKFDAKLKKQTSQAKGLGPASVSMGRR
jgi:hypothetical protein